MAAPEETTGERRVGWTTRALLFTCSALVWTSTTLVAIVAVIFAAHEVFLSALYDLPRFDGGIVTFALGVIVLGGGLTVLLLALTIPGVLALVPFGGSLLARRPKTAWATALVGTIAGALCLNPLAILSGVVALYTTLDHAGRARRDDGATSD